MDGKGTALEDDGAGSHEMAVARPEGRLAGRVLRLAGYSESSGAAVRRREVPTAGVVLVLSFGDPMRVSSPSGESPVAVTSFVAGLHEGPALTEHDGRQHGVQIDLTPLGAYALLGVAMSDLVNVTAPLDAVLGRRADELAGRVADAPGWPERFRLLEDALSSAMDAGPRPSPPVAWLYHQLAGCAGRSTVGDLAEETGWSRRHLAARFRAEVGVTPKALARLFRFRHAVRLLSNDTAPGGPAGAAPGGLAGLAAAAGYYDQAHFNREFRSFAGCTPREYLAGAVPAVDPPA